MYFAAIDGALSLEISEPLWAALDWLTKVGSLVCGERRRALRGIGVGASQGKLRAASCRLADRGAALWGGGKGSAGGEPAGVQGLQLRATAARCEIPTSLQSADWVSACPGPGLGL